MKYRYIAEAFITMQSLLVQRIVIMGIGSMLLSGCASSPTGNIEAFGSAATEVSTSIDTVISDQ